MSEEQKKEIREGMESFREDCREEALRQENQWLKDELREANETIDALVKNGDAAHELAEKRRLEILGLECELKRSTRDREAASDKIAAADRLVKKWHKRASRRKACAAALLVVYLGTSAALTAMAGAGLCPVWPALLPIANAIGLAAVTGWWE